MDLADKFISAFFNNNYFFLFNIKKFGCFIKLYYICIVISKK